MWRIVAYARLAGVVAAVTWGLIATQPVSATNSTVLVQVCGLEAVSRLGITTPKSDTVFRKLPITLTGTAELIGQIEVYIDGKYHKTIAIPIGKTEFSTDLNPQPGTRSIAVQGVSVCDGADLEDEVVITYSLPVSPTAPTDTSAGSKTPTIINPADGGQFRSGGVVVNNIALVDDNLVKQGDWSASRWGNLFRQDFGNWAMRTIDFDTTWKQGSDSWLRIMMFFGGLVMIIWAGRLSSGVVRRQTVIRIAGLVLLIAGLLFVV